MNDISVQKSEFKHDSLDPPGVNGYDQCWYPVARSQDLKPGDIIGEDYFGGRVVIWRGESGKAHVMGAYCRHLGASLCTGEVLGEEVRCCFHYWRYGADGKCAQIPSGEPIPDRARLYTFPTAERYGLIWAFNGDEPQYDLPQLPGDESELEIIVSEPHEEEVEHHMLLSNSYDFQHLKWVHDLELVKLPDDITFENFGASYEAEFTDPNLGEMKQYHRLFGTNAFHLAGTFKGFELISMPAMIDLPNGRTRLWVITASPKGKTAEEKKAVAELLQTGEAFAFKLMKDDYPITHNVRFTEDVLVESDWAIHKYLDYLRDYPRAQPPVI